MEGNFKTQKHEQKASCYTSMETKRSIEEIEPFCKWQREEQQDVLELHLQGFKKEQLRVQMNNLGVLTISGERPVDQNKRVCFSKEIKVSKQCKPDELQAKFSGGILYITMPKRIPSSLLPTTTTTQNQQTAAAAGGTSGRLSMMSMPTTFVSALQQMRGKTALKLGALAAVIAVAAVGAYVAFKHRRGFHED